MKKFIFVLAVVVGSNAHAYTANGSVQIVYGSGGAIAYNGDSTPPPAGKQALVSQAVPSVKSNLAATRIGAMSKSVAIRDTLNNPSPSNYTHTGGVGPGDGGVQYCHARGFKDKNGLIHEDRYQKCNTYNAIDKETCTCSASGQCSISRPGY